MLHFFGALCTYSDRWFGQDVLYRIHEHLLQSYIKEEDGQLYLQ